MMESQLIRKIEQRLDDLSFFDEDLFSYYESELYYADKIDEPIVELFTPELLEEIERHIEQLDHD